MKTSPLRRLLVLVLFSATVACGGGHTGHVVDGGVVAGSDGGSSDGGSSDGGTVAGDGGAALLPNPALIVANGEGSVSIVDPAALRAVATNPVEAGHHPHHLSVSPDRSHVLVTATSADLSLGHGGGGHGGHGTSATTMVYQLDSLSGEFGPVLDIAATAHNATFTRDGATIVLAMMEHGMIAGYDAATYDETFTATGFSMPLEVTTTGVGTLLVAESGSTTLAKFDLARKRVTARFDVGATPVAAWSSGGAEYFVSVEGAKRVRHIVEGDLDVSLDSHAIDPTGVPGQAVRTPGGRGELWVAVEDRAVIAVFNAVSHEKLGEIPAGTKPHGIAFEPSGARAFVTDEGAARVLVFDVASRRLSGEIAVGAKPNGIVWLAR